ncbi:MAG: ribosomal-processing cysteine protease Prp [Bacilli bacterium]
MIEIEISRVNYINSFEVKGHANYLEYGKDIVCASVSSMTIFAFNLCLELNKNVKYEQENGYLKLRVNEYFENVDIVLNRLSSMLDELRIQYPEYISIVDGGENDD